MKQYRYSIETNTKNNLQVFKNIDMAKNSLIMNFRYRHLCRKWSSKSDNK